MSTAKVIDLNTLLGLRARWRAAGRTVVWTNGCYDLLHVGHVRGLQEARGLGDVLVVGVNSDASVRKLKGPARPVVPEAERAEVLAALGCVDHVLVFGEDTPVEVLGRLRPDVHCKGADYAPPSARPIPEAETVRSYGGRLAFLGFSPGASTTDIVRRIEQGLRRGPATPAGRPALFLDRDGTLVEDTGYPRDPRQVRLVPGAAGALARLSGRGFALVIVSNQSGVGRGLISGAEAEAVQAEVVRQFAAAGVAFDGAYYCYHAPDEGCPCRKPQPGLLLRAVEELNLDPGRSFMVGDKAIDVAAGEAAGCRGIRLGAGAAGWPEVVRLIEGETREAA